MCWQTFTSTTRDSSGGLQNTQTLISVGPKKLLHIKLRRIPVNLFLFRVGHFWLEFIYDDEKEMDEFMLAANEAKLTQHELGQLGQKCTKANGYRESYGWYPTSMPVQLKNLFNSKLVISSGGVLNGDDSKRRKKDDKKQLTHESDREAGRQETNNEYSIRAFDPHQNGQLHENKIHFTSHPYVLPGDLRTHEQIYEEIVTFAKGFEDEWSWAFDSYKETNCHTLLFLLLASCNLADPDCIGQNEDRHFIAYKKSLSKKNKNRDKKFVIRLELIEKLSELSQSAKLG